jgi:predicted SnoaL-like aldol condensation-catalyzing enzyme
MQPEYPLDLLNANDDYHTDVIRSKLTRIYSTFKEVRVELVMAMGDLIPTHEHSTWQGPRQRGYSSYSMRSG